MDRRDILKIAGGAAAVASPLAASGFPSRNPLSANPGPGDWLSVRQFGAKGDGSSVDSPAINKAIDSAAVAGGGTVYFPAGIYLSYSIRLKSKVALFLDPGAVILAGPTPLEGTSSGGYDAPEPQGEWEHYQDYGHNHWHNSLIWGEELDNVAITGTGLIWGKGLNHGHDVDPSGQRDTAPGAGNKAIALKNCRNVLLRDFKILEGGWFGVLATGVDNLTIDNLVIDTVRDGIDIDCCRNVRVSNCTVNSPYDDGICPKSSFALGHARPTENLTISNCYVTGAYAVGSVINATWKPIGRIFTIPHGRIKLGTESNGGFRNITISNCVFDGGQGFALESLDGAVVEDITFTGITMRGILTAPLFLRLGARMRGPAGVAVGTMKRVILSNITSSGSSRLPSILAGVPGHLIEDVKISDCFFHQVGGGSAAMAAIEPEEREKAYPDPMMFGDLPATGFFARHVRNLEMSNVEIATLAPDKRAAFWLADVDGADFFRLRLPEGTAPAFDLHSVSDFRVFGSRGMPDQSFENVGVRKI